MNRTMLIDPALDTFELTKNSTFGGGDSGFSGSRDESDVNRDITRLSNYSTISGGACLQLGEFDSSVPKTFWNINESFLFAF